MQLYKHDEFVCLELYLNAHSFELKTSVFGLKTSISVEHKCD